MKIHHKLKNDVTYKHKIKRTNFFKTWDNIYFSPIALQQYLKLLEIKGNKKLLTNLLVFIHDNEANLSHVRYAKKDKYSFISNRQLSLFGWTATKQDTLVNKLNISKSTIQRGTKELEQRNIILKEKVHKMYYYAVIDTLTRLLMLHSAYLDIFNDMLNNVTSLEDGKHIQNILKTEYKMLLELIDTYADVKQCTLEIACIKILDALNLYFTQMDMYTSGALDVHAQRSSHIKELVTQFYGIV